MVRAGYRRMFSSALIILALVLVALFGLARPSSVLAADTDGMNELVANSLRISFGNAAVGSTSPSHTETVTNSFGDDMVTFSSTFATQGYVVMNDTCGSTLAPLQPCNVDVACKPTKTGYRFGVLAFFYTSADTSPEIDLWDNFPKATFVALTCTGTPLSVSGQAIQNGMNGAAITAVTVNADGSDGATLGTATADVNGNFSMMIASAQTGPVRFRASGGSYVSEQNGATISSPSPLSVLLPNLPNNLSGLSINPLTTFVDSLALGNISRGQLLATAVTNSKASIENDYGISTDPSTLTPLYTMAAIGTDSGRLGLILGAIVNEDELACPTAPGGLVTALSTDISDGIFDGTKSGTPVSYCGGNLYAIAGTAGFSDALSGLQQLALATSGFTYGGLSNELSLNGVTAADVAADAATIEKALLGVPISVNTFAASTPTMNAVRTTATATLLPNGKVLIAGGFNFNGPGLASLATTELYDPVGNTFAALASTPSMNFKRSSATATLLPNGKVLIAGGTPDAGMSFLSSTDLYDPGTNTFAASTPTMNTARENATATLMPNGKVMIAGGQNDSSALSSTELYDPVTNTFAASTLTMNAARAFATATLLPNGKVLIAGGVGFSGVLSSTELYDPVTNSFAASAAMNVARELATATLLPNGKVLVSGGLNNVGTSLGSTELYDLATNTFAAAPVMNTARFAATATLFPNGKVLIAGGQGNAGLLGGTELYDSATNTFAASTPPMNVARENATATLLPNGKVVIAGGGGNGSVLGSTELYTP
jgi:galactose oxidase-like protein